MITVSLRGVWKKFPSGYILRGIDLSLRRGRIAVIAGRSGVGKTTLLRMIGLLEMPTRGDVRVLGINPLKSKRRDLARIRLGKIGFIHQDFNLLPELNVLENVELPMALAGLDKRKRRERALRVLRALDMEGFAHRYPDALSGGERQRVAIARALAKEPDLLLADEPFSNLDEDRSRIVLDLFKSLKDECTIVITKTSLGEKLPADDQYILSEGKLVRM